MVLHSIRERATGWFAWVIVILISIPFALWGINSYITPDSNPAVAHVGDYNITVQEFQNALQTESKQFQGQLDDSLIKKLVLDKIINNRALINFLNENRFTISKQQVDYQILNDPNFQKDGKFSEELYNRYLPSTYSKSNYRNSLATQLLLAQLSDGIIDSSFVSDAEVTRLIQLIKQKREISYAIIKSDNFKDQVTISDEEINNYYQNFQSQFENPEQISLAYVELSRRELAKDVVVSDDIINKYYQDNIAQFTQPERRKASHILFALPADANSETKDKIKADAQVVLDKIKSGADFSELAKTYSQDPGSAEKGGDLGFFAKDEMVPAFENVAFSLKPNEVSDLVESPFGFHIIKLAAVEGGKPKAFESVREKIEQTIQFEEVGDVYFEKTELMQATSFEQPDSLEPVASELNTEIKKSDLISKAGGEGIFANPKLLSAAFSNTVLEEGINSDLIELGEDHAVVIRLLDRIPANVKPLDEVKSEIETRLQKEAIITKAQEQATELLNKLTDGTSLKQLSEDNSFKFEHPGEIERQTTTVPGEILSKAFNMPRELKYATTKMMNGDIAIIAIDSIKDGESTDQSLFDNIKQALLKSRGNMEQSLSVLQIRSDSKIEINAEQLSEE